jgi:hypothetical protein
MGRDWLSARTGRPVASVGGAGKVGHSRTGRLVGTGIFDP